MSIASTLVTTKPMIKPKHPKLKAPTNPPNDTATLRNEKSVTLSHWLGLV